MERKFKKGEKVWYKPNQDIFDFLQYNQFSVKERFGDVRIWSEKYGEYDCNLVDIEPYAGQDKIQKANEILRNLFCGKEKPSETLKMITDNDHLNSVGTKSPYPFTVILKSGVKIGIDENTNNILNEKLKCKTVVSVRLKDFGFIYLHEIAAIVPTENLML